MPHADPPIMKREPAGTSPASGHAHGLRGEQIFEISGCRWAQWQCEITRRFEHGLQTRLGALSAELSSTAVPSVTPHGVDTVSTLARYRQQRWRESLAAAGAPRARAITRATQNCQFERTRKDAQAALRKRQGQGAPRRPPLRARGTARPSPDTRAPTHDRSDGARGARRRVEHGSVALLRVHGRKPVQKLLHLPRVPNISQARRALAPVM